MVSDVRRSKVDLTIFLSGVSAIVLIDRLSKMFFVHLLDLNESLVVIKNFFYFTLVHNTGIAFGLFKDQGMVFIIIPLILTGLMVYNIYYYRHSAELSRTYIVAFSLILGGAIGNLIDRIMFGYVVDFIDFKVWPVFNLGDGGVNLSTTSWPVFNIADSAIFIGAVVIIIKCIPFFSK